MSRLTRLAARAMPLTTTSGRRLAGMYQTPTGNILRSESYGTRGTQRGVKAATQNITYASPGQPLMLEWDGIAATEAYYQSLWTMRCVRTIAETLAQLPFITGKSARDPNRVTPNSQLQHFLGPPPGSPNPRTSGRALWCWSVVQYLITGKMVWETQLGPNKQIVGIWPMVSANLTPIPTIGTNRWWDGFQYQTPYGIIPLKEENVMYAWRPSQRDWRQPESALESAVQAIALEVGIEKYMNGLLKNGLTAAHVVITPPFEEPEMRRAWQEQFMQEFTGFDNAGRTIFGETELSEKDQRIPNIQIQQVGTRPVDAQLLQMWQQAKIDVTVALGVPESLIGNASDRTYSNADSEYRNFWTITMAALLAEIEEAVNVHLAPRLGDDVGWFDVSRVVALQGPSVFAPLAPDKAVVAGIVTAEEVARLLDITGAALDKGSIETAKVGEEAVMSGPVGTGSTASAADARGMFTRLETRAYELSEALVEARALSSDDIADKVHGYLARNYPRRTLDWVHEAEWERDRAVPLKKIQMERRPGGPRDPDKVVGIAKAIDAGTKMDPIVLVRAPGEEKYRIADGYHRALAHRHAGKTSLDAYIGETAEAHGPWEKAMHVSKKNRAYELLDQALKDPERRMIAGLPPEGPVSPKPQEPKVYPPATKPRTEPFSMMAYKPHAFKGNDLARCATCLQPVLSAIHVAAFSERAMEARANEPKEHDGTTRQHSATIAAHQEMMFTEWGRTLSQLFNQQREAVLARLGGKRGRQMLRSSNHNQNQNVDAAAVFFVPFWIAKTVEVLAPLYLSILMLARQEAAEQLADGDSSAITTGDVYAAKAAMNSRAQMLAQEITDTTARQLSKAFTESVANNETADEMADRVRAIFSQAIRTRVPVISHTAVVGALNSALYEFGLSLGARMRLERIWVTMHDNRVRPAHRVADGQTRRLGEPFDIGGFPAQFPGDPALPPDLSINCRCHLVYRHVVQRPSATPVLLQSGTMA